MEKQMKTYEGMFLLDSGQPNFETASEPIRKMLDRSEGEIISLKPWEERKLAYEINKRKRGLYALGYFKMDPEKLVEFERDCKLNEEILRVLVLRKENLTDEIINAETPAMTAPAADEAPKAEEAEAAAPSEAPAEEATPAEAEEATEEKAEEAAE